MHQKHKPLYTRPEIVAGNTIYKTEYCRCKPYSNSKTGSYNKVLPYGWARCVAIKK